MVPTVRPRLIAARLMVVRRPQALYRSTSGTRTVYQDSVNQKW
jgi:hypothetical protein